VLPAYGARSRATRRWHLRADVVTAVESQRQAGDVVITDLTIEYSSGGYAVRPIDGLDLTMKSGNLTILLGASGCGKSSLLAALAAILTPKSGSIRVGATEVVGLRAGELMRYRRHMVGIIFQSFNLIPSMTALENVMLPLRSAGVPHRQARPRAMRLLEQVRLGDRLRHKPGDLSGGQQQRVAIARALAHSPPLILADEPTAHLDYIQVEGVLRLLRSLASPGRVVVVATHDERIIPLADQVIELTPHAVSDAGAPDRVTLQTNEVLFRQGDRGDRIYVVEEGEIELVRTLIDGQEERLAIASAGGYFGELAPLFGLQRAATARAVTDSTLTSYSVRDFRSLKEPGSIAELLDHGVDASP
jgi:putative ABC transport system ATP-binding protein